GGVRRLYLQHVTLEPTSRTHSRRGHALGQFQVAFSDLAMPSCSLSLRERVRVRGFFPGSTRSLRRHCVVAGGAATFTPRPLPEGEGAIGDNHAAPTGEATGTGHHRMYRRAQMVWPLSRPARV